MMVLLWIDERSAAGDAGREKERSHLALVWEP